MDRRIFVKGTAASAFAVTFGQAFWKEAWAAPAIAAPGPYGALSATPNSDGLFLPAGFTSRKVAIAGQVVGSSSYTWHPSPDGGATYAHAGGGWTYVSNSEVTPGGAGSVTFDALGNITGARRILSGTRNNCAGGPTPWGTWMSCEETGGGWIFDCLPLGPDTAAVRLDALGQRAHEAAAVDPIAKVIYTTEDDGSSRFYRWIANDWTGASPNFAAGGTLQALSANLTAALSGPTPVTWVNVTNLTTGYRGANSSVFQRGEGCWIDGQTVYFTSTTDSNVWAVDGVNQTIEVVYQGGTGGALTQADNITVHAPSRDLFVGEDSGNLELCIITSPYSNGNRAIAPFMRFDVSLGSGSEVAGPAFSPDGTRLYVSSQRATSTNPGGGGSGVTYEITGPFRTTPGGSGGPATPPSTTTTTTTTAPPPAGTQVQLFGYETSWKYLDTGVDLTPSFAAASFNDAAWASATIQAAKVLGYGDADSQTPNLSFGPNSAQKYRTTYFRKSINIGNPALINAITFTLIRDDGAVVYVNGTEVFRSNMPTGPIVRDTFASDANPERFEDIRTIPASVLASVLVPGANVIGVEVHQASASSSDMAFKMKATAFEAAAPPPATTPVEIFPYETDWKYLDDGSAITPVFAASSYSDTAWASATVEANKVLGYGDSDSQTPNLSFGPSSTQKYTTTYFRKAFTIADPAQIYSLAFSLIRDDGAVVYLNGVEIFRSNMPTGAITAATFAATNVSPERFEDVRELTGSALASRLVAGTNVVAVEVHQTDLTSSDLAFKMKLSAAQFVAAQVSQFPAPLTIAALGAVVVGGALMVQASKGSSAEKVATSEL
jgi:uncharacterized protein